MNEKYIEQKLRMAVKNAGGLALKFVSPGFNGVPDRLILMSDGQMAFAELKAPGKRMRPIQVRRKEQFQRLGFKVYLIDSPEQIGGMIDEIQRS